MTATFEVNMRGLNARINQIHDALVGRGQGGDAANIIKDEKRRLIKQVINFTPPNQGKVGPESRKRGEKAVDGDVRKTMTPFNEEHFPRLYPRVLELAKGKLKRNPLRRLAQIEAILRNIKTKYRPVEFDTRIHRAAQGSRGRTRRTFAVLVNPKDFTQLERYVKKIKGRVGRMAAALMPSYEVAGGVIRTPWIRRHRSGTRGKVFADLGGQRPFIRTVWRAPGVGIMRNVVQNAVRVRSVAIGKRIRLVVSGYNKQIKAKMIVSRQAHKSAQFAETGEV
jgi:hypothetical protein